MAKKGKEVQLQLEVNTDDEWEKLLQKDGLIVVDIYSEWCGPCSGMQATLKKIKLEIGGDTLQLAIAKSDHIEALARFKNKSEPTWMFIANGKMVNFMFGANAPKLTRIITEELKKEMEVRDGKREREFKDITEMADEERERFEIIAEIAKKTQEREEAKKIKELHDRKTAECENILEALPHLGIILIFPQAKDNYMAVLSDLLAEAALNIGNTEKITLSEPILQDLFYFEPNPLSDEEIEYVNDQISLAVLIKNRAGQDLDPSMEGVLLEMIYGKSKCPPGDDQSPAQILSKAPPQAELTETGGELNEPEQHDRTGIWTPSLGLTKSIALKLFFTKLVENHLLPEPEPIPQHYLVVFEAHRRREIMKALDNWRNEVMRYGFFTSETPEEAELVAKTFREFEKKLDRPLENRFVLQLAKRKSECILTLAQMRPVYMSPNVFEGERECKIFFPDEYDADFEPEELMFDDDDVVTTVEEVSEVGVEEFEEEQEEFEEQYEDGEEQEEEEKIDEDALLVLLTEDILDELMYFEDPEPENLPLKDILKTKSTALLLKRSSDDLPKNIDDIICQVVFGNPRTPPGTEGCPYQLLEKDDLDGIWVPLNKYSKALALKLLFPNVSAPYRLPETKPIPPHLALGYDAFKYRELMELSAKYPDQLIRYGIFNADLPKSAKLLFKTYQDFESKLETHPYEEKIVIQLAKTNEECVENFLDVGPSYSSQDAVQGEIDCKIFFPDGYDEPDEVIAEVKKRIKKKKYKPVQAQKDEESSQIGDDKELEESDMTMTTESKELEREDDDIEATKKDEEEIVSEARTDVDKATSPMGDEHADENLEENS